VEPSQLADPALFDFMALARSPATAVPSPPSAWTDATPDIGGAPGPA
jgi:tRNA 2-thiocytidine biosynthesis protein TtcA